MKRNEIALLILIVGGVGLATYFTLNTLLKSSFTPKVVEVDTATEITATLTDMDVLKKRLFVEGSYNPTIKVTIGDQANQQPFNKTTQ